MAFSSILKALFSSVKMERVSKCPTTFGRKRRVKEPQHHAKRKKKKKEEEEEEEN